MSGRKERSGGRQAAASDTIAGGAAPCDPGASAGKAGRRPSEGTASLVDAFRRALVKLLPESPPGPWIAALSGGCDSTALCRLLHEASAGSGGPVPPHGAIRAVHVHHGLRGAEADRDEEASAALAASLGFAFESVRVNPPAGLAPGAVEKWARTERYRVLQEAAAASGASLVLTGHNRNDQAETVLLRVLHGAGYWGLAGIRPVRPILWGSPVLLARPLLGFARRELHAYLDALGQTFSSDRTNEEVSFERNRVRLRLLPLLEEAAGSSPAAELEGIAAAALSLHTLVDGAAERLLDRWSGPGQGRVLPVSMPLDRFLKVPEPVRFSLLRLAAHRAAPRQVPLARTAYASVIDALADPRPGRPFKQEWALGRGAVLRRRGRSLLIERGIGPEASPPAPVGAFSLDLDVPGTVVLPDGTRITASLTSDLESVRLHLARSRAGREKSEVEVLDADRAAGRIHVRSRRPGDTFHPLGAPGRRKLKSFLIDSRIPLEKRGTLPLVCCNDEIVWVVGSRISETARVTKATRSFLVLRRETADSAVQPTERDSKA